MKKATYILKKATAVTKTVTVTTAETTPITISILNPVSTFGAAQLINNKLITTTHRNFYHLLVETIIPMLEEGPLFKTVVSALNEEVGSMLLEVMEYLGEVVTAMPRLDTAELEFVAELIIIVEEAICISEVYIVLIPMVSLVEGNGAGVVLVLSLVVGAVTAILLGVA